jgi:hypothetical protein
VAPPEAALPGAVDVFRHVGIAVVVAVVSGPPENALLRRRLTQEGHEELRHAPSWYVRWLKYRWKPAVMANIRR